MRFLVDAQLPPALARWLAANGHAAEHVADRQMESRIQFRDLGLCAARGCGDHYERRGLRPAQNAQRYGSGRDLDTLGAHHPHPDPPPSRGREYKWGC